MPAPGAALNKRYTSIRWWSEVVRARALPLINSVGFKPQVVNKRIENEAVLFLVATPTAKAWYGTSLEHTSQELRFARQHILRPGMQVLELGGHHGHDTIPLARWVSPGGRVVTVEPLPENVAILRQNVELNELDNVSIVPAGAGAATMQARLKAVSNGSIETGDGGLAVPILTVDDICEAENLDPDVIKIDIEGYEVDALIGAKLTLQSRPALHIELHVHALPKYGRTVGEFWSLIDWPAYDLWLQLDDLQPPVPVEAPPDPPYRCHVFCIPKDW